MPSKANTAPAPGPLPESPRLPPGRVPRGCPVLAEARDVSCHHCPEHASRLPGPAPPPSPHPGPASLPSSGEGCTHRC